MNNRLDENQIVTAYSSFRLESGANLRLDPCKPASFPTRFLDRVRQQAGEVEEEAVLRKLLNLRKRSRLPRG